MEDKSDQIIAMLKQQQKMIEKQEKEIKSIRRAQKLSQLFSLLKLIFIIAPVIGIWYFFPRIIDFTSNRVQNAFDINLPINSNTFKGAPQDFDFSQFQDLLKE